MKQLKIAAFFSAAIVAGGVCAPMHVLESEIQGGAMTVTLHRRRKREDFSYL